MSAPTISVHEQESIVRRLNQIAVELEHARLTASQLAALDRERMSLQLTLAQDLCGDLDNPQD